MSTVLVHLRADLEGDLSSLDSMHELFASLWNELPEISSRDRALFSLAVAEIAANVVEHLQSVSRSWELDLKAWNDRLEALIRHAGPVVERALTESMMPGEMVESGRGLALAAAASSLHYSHCTDPEGSEWRVVHSFTI